MRLFGQNTTRVSALVGLDFDDVDAFRFDGARKGVELLPVWFWSGPG